MLKRALLALLTVVAVGACPDTKPAKIEFTQPPTAIFSKESFNFSGHLVTAAGGPAEGGPVTYSAIPADVLSVGPAGNATCEKSGDATVTMAGGGLSAVATVKCRLVGAVTAKKGLRVIIGTDAADLDIQVSATDGSRMTDVPLSFEGHESSLVDIDQHGRVTGRAVGKTTVTIKAGTVGTQTSLEVVEKVKSEPLAIPDDGLVTYTLQTGKYLVEVQAKAGSTHGVTLSWVGAPCAPQPERQEHKVYCTIENTASLTISNPAVLGLGAPANGFINLYRVP